MDRGEDHEYGSGRRPKPSPSPLRMPPASIEAEMGVIAGILMDPNKMDDVAAILPDPAMFFRDAHQVLWRFILEEYRSSRPVDVVAISEGLGRARLFDRIGGNDGLAEILNSVPHAANTLRHAGIVLDKFMIRSPLEIMTNLIGDGYSGVYTGEEFLSRLQSQLFPAMERFVGNRAKLVADVAGKVMDGIHSRCSGGEIVGLESPWPELDFLTTGFRDEELIIVGARPSMGKTAFGMGLALHFVRKLKVPSLFVSLEMGEESLTERLFSLVSGVSGHFIRTGQGLKTVHIAALGKAYDNLRDVPLWIDDTPAQSMLQIMATSRRLRRRERIGCVVVDYLQLVEPDNHRDSRQEQVAKVSRRMKQLARELHVPVICLAQLNREAEKREDHRPRMSDLKESGGTEQDADKVLLLHRPDYYDPNDRPGEAEVIVAKHRNGPTGTATLVFLKDTMRFASRALPGQVNGEPTTRPEDAPF